MKRLLLVGLLLSAACTARPHATPRPVTLIPYSTVTPPAASLGLEGLVTIPAPLASPTPFTYTVQAGETMGGIALKFGVSLEDLQAANPGISPNAMSIGQVLRIPSDPANPSGEPTPTPAPFPIQQIQCYPGAAQSMTCLVLAHNDTTDLYENLIVQVTLVGTDGGQVASSPALLPLNILPPGASLPLGVFFPSGIPSDARPRVQVLTAVRLLPGDARYLPAALQNVTVQVNWRGRSAQAVGEVSLPPGLKNAATVWVAAAAYDGQGRVVGYRRWEGGALPAGGSLPFMLLVSSLGAPIARVELAVEARP